MHTSANSESVQSGKKGLDLVLDLLILGHCQKVLPILGRIFPFQPSGNILTNLARNMFLTELRSYHVDKIIENIQVGVQLLLSSLSRVRKSKTVSRNMWKMSSLAREISSASLTLQIIRTGEHLSFIITILVLSTTLYSRTAGICSLGGSITHLRFYLVKVLTYIKAESELRMSLKKVVCTTKQQSGRIISQIQIILKEGVRNLDSMWSWQQSLSMLSVKYQCGNHEDKVSIGS